MSTRARRSALSVVAIGVLSAASFASAPAVRADSTTVTTPAVMARTSQTVTTDPLPTAQIDGVAYAQVVAGSTVFAGGSFARARPAGAGPGTSEVVRSNLLAYDLDTGELTSFAPVLNGRVKSLALSSDGKTLYVGGVFTKVGSKTRDRFAAFDVASGRLTSLAPDFNSSVNALAVSGRTVYAGGDFSVVSGKRRTRLAAFSVSTRKIRSWAPTADRAVHAMVVTPDKSGVVVGGSFGTLNKRSARGMGLLSAKDGKVRTWKINGVVKDFGESSAVLSLVADKDTVYGSTFAAGGGNFEGVFAASPKDGAVRWLQDCHGDTYSVVPAGDVVYSVGHAHFCSNIGGFPESRPQTNYRALAVSKAARGVVATNAQLGAHYGNFAGQPAPSLVNWFPSLTMGTYTGMSQAAWTVTAAHGYLLLGGEFVGVDGREQQGLVRLALPAAAPRAQGPVLTGSAFSLTASVAEPGSVALSWPGNYDRDDLKLTYDVLRDGAVVGSRVTQVPFWANPDLRFTDRGLRPGQTYAYRVRVRDDDGNAVLSREMSVLVPGSPSSRPSPSSTPTP